MYKGKPLIIQKRPWWRHPIFPWGWYSLSQDVLLIVGSRFNADGCYSPDDGGGGEFVAQDTRYTENVNDGGSYCGTVFVPSKGDGTIGFFRQYDGHKKVEWFGAKEG